VWGSLPAAISGISAARLPALTPTAVAGVNGATMLALGARHGCALLPSQQVYCWGQNEFLQLGGGEQTPTAAFLIVPNLTDAVAIEAGQTSTCALRSNGEVSCWGALGCSSTLCAVGPTDVPALVDARQVSVGGGTACALRSGGAVVCWGAVGNGAVAIPTPVPGLDDAVALAATDELDGHCAERASGEVVCWRSSLELEPVVGLPN
jgi:alpha-tubulin suppressor-like RCC1 family protein